MNTISNIKLAVKRFCYNVATSSILSPLTNNRLILRLYANNRARSRRKKLLLYGKKQYDKGSSIGSLEDFRLALEKHWVTFSEYAYQYEFYKKSEEERNEFISNLKMEYFYRIYIPNVAKKIFHFKPYFLRMFSTYIHRQWIYVPEASFEEYKELVTNHDCIVKPCDATIGKGVFKIKKEQDNVKNKINYDYFKKNKMLVEECIESCEELKALHPESLNTIRVLTVSNKDKAEVFGSFIRMGVGDKIVDNAHAGGIFAQININNGKIESDGIDVNGHTFQFHPDTKIQLKGFQIPKWDAIVGICCEAAKKSPITIVGWDVAINNKGEILFVEGNHQPAFDVMQSPLQIGVKKKIYAKIKEYTGIELF